ncbi:carboxyltransferase domain-containing protein [Devosia sp. 2618]|uniref:5-oxoprolinase subunit B family protein n=1 Tax=Devosia sp. 2618 TaxID=3156454 RepID=UPI00339A6EC3
MAGSTQPRALPTPAIVPLGDSAIVVRFETSLTDAANKAAIAFAAALDSAGITGVLEVAPSLVSVLLRYDPITSSYAAIAGELRLLLSGPQVELPPPANWTIPVAFTGPDLDEVAALLGKSSDSFIEAHNASPLRALATGFAPGFVYLGLHPQELVVPRRQTVRTAVPAGSVLFAAGQTAITATEMPTGWHVIGHTDFSNFDPLRDPPTRLSAGDAVSFSVKP